MMALIVADKLVSDPQSLGPHVVLLGAGASRASFPAGDANGRGLPVLEDLADMLNLRKCLAKRAPELATEANFELIYSRLRENSAGNGLADELEGNIRDYFGSLVLPDSATHYDRILLSLRSKDAIFTFNWDPFLFDAYERNRHVAPLPPIYFLHGNVRIGACRTHGTWGPRRQPCPVCSDSYEDVPLLFPVRVKDYSADPYLARAWEAARAFFQEAFTMTVFGYGAPATDRDAVSLLRTAWLADSPRVLEHIEVIDIAPADDLHARWSPFAPTLHVTYESDFAASRIARWPRRTCESLIFPMRDGVPCEDFPLPSSNGLEDLQMHCRRIAANE